ncbi:hypothetical protein HLB32_31975 [Streptomyces cacaoi]|uniref:condensation domain-containing protein n=1 Tax=Streptomyces cacaoi TaxID=1898 RepID=UPI0014783301|nr:condensation domain-containing protein [Streptomyces cacaoi]NNG89396.1 hypothetical protein [Streptomyces cacaoi]
MLAAACAAALGLPSVGVDDDFFALGGTSLTAIRLAGRLRTALRVPVSVRDIFEAPTVTALDQRLPHPGPAATPAADPALGHGPAAEANAGGAIPPGPVPAPTAPTAPERPARLPLSPAQQSMWTATYLGGHRPAYLTALALDLEGEPDPVALRAAVGDLADRHESLRTLLPYGDEGPEQHILPPGAQPPDFRAVQVEDDGLADALAAELAAPFDLLTQLPLRARLLTAAPDRHVLLLVLHHVAADGASMAPLRADLRHAYAARRAGHPPHWERPAPQYADHVLEQRRRLGDPGLPDSPAARQARYWRAQLDGVPGRLELPGARPEPDAAPGAAGSVPFTVGPHAHRLLEEAAGRCAASPYMLLHTAFAAALTGLGAGPDIPVVVALSGRDEEDMDGLVGCVVQPVVVRTDTAGDPSGGQLVDRVREVLLQAHAHQEHPYEEVLEELARHSAREGRSLFTAAVSYLRTGAAGTDTWPGGLTARTRTLPVTHTDIDLLLQLREERAPDGGPAGITGELVHARAYCDTATARRVVTAVEDRLAALCADPSAPLVRAPAPQRA